jgi:predicted metal-binding transcription factor (methanogenesis marker protein 9)
MTYVVNGWFQTAETLVSPVRVSCPELLLLNSKVSSKAAEHSFAKRTLAWALSESSFGKAVLCCCLTQPLLLVMP